MFVYLGKTLELLTILVLEKHSITVLIGHFILLITNI